MTKRCDINDVRKEFEEEGYTLLTDIYKNAHTKLEYLCSNGHKSFTTYSNWHFGKRRCKYCSNQAPVVYKDIKEALEKEGYTLLSKEYIKSSAKLEYICPKGTHGKMCWNSFQQGHRCQCCYGKNNKLTIEEVKKSFSERGATLLEKEYVNSKTKLSYVCNSGHERQTTWDSWNAGHGCSICAGQESPTIEKIRNEFAKENYILLDEEYKGNKIKLKYKCPEGHIHSITWGKWLQGKRCAYCVGGIPLDYSYIKNSFEKEGYTLLTKEYKNSNSLLTYVCPNGHETTSKWVNWSHGSRCRRCFADRTMIPFKQVKALFNNEGYYLVSTTYKGSGHKLDVVCPIGHSYSVSYSNWRAGYRCPVCAIIKNSGENSHNWKGGISFEPYCPVWKDKEYKNDIKERDGNRCLNPYCEGKEGHSGKLVIHHIDYNKKNCSPTNLITVCIACNSKANIDREWHEAWYKAIMLKRYNVGGV